MTGFVLLRAGAHRLLLAAAVLTVLLTNCVLTSLAAVSASFGDAALHHALRKSDSGSVSLKVTAQISNEGMARAHETVARGAANVFDGLPVTVRRIERSGPYALPSSLRAEKGAPGDPGLTYFAALDRSRIRVTSGALPGRATADAGAVEAALPEAASRQLGLRPRAQLNVSDRLTGKAVRVHVTGVYRPSDPSDPYWRLDSLGGHGVRSLTLPTYGPLVTNSSVLASGRVSRGGTAWLASADFRTMTTDRIGTLRSATRREVETLEKHPVFAGSGTVNTSLSSVLERTERALLVSRTTLLLVAVQLVLIAVCTLLLLAGQLRTRRMWEVDLLRARGASRRRVVALAAVETALLALPAMVCAPLLSGPLVGLLAERSALPGVPLHQGYGPAGHMWLTSTTVALCCTAAVLAPVIIASAEQRSSRYTALDAPLRTGADVALVAVAGVAYWQVERRATRSSTDAAGDGFGPNSGVDLLLIATPALALLAGTAAMLRLLPLAARLAERGAAVCRSLEPAMASWQISRRPMHFAGPLLLVLAVAMGTMGIGQSASWERSQGDQADFATGAPVRVVETGPVGPGDRYTALPGVRAAAPAHRGVMGLSGNRAAKVLALDTARAGEQLKLREDLANETPRRLLDAIAAVQGPPPGVTLPRGTKRLTLRLRITGGKTAGTSSSSVAPAITLVLQDRYANTYRIPAGHLPADGLIHAVTGVLDGATGPDTGVPGGAAGGSAALPEPLVLTDLQLDGAVPDGPGQSHSLHVERLLATDERGRPRPVIVPRGLRWQGTYTVEGEPAAPVTLRTAASPAQPLTAHYEVGPASTAVNGWGFRQEKTFGVRISVKRPDVPKEVPVVATDEFLRASSAKLGDSVDVLLGGENLRATIVRTVRQLPTTGPDVRSSVSPRGESGADTSGAGDGGALLIDLRTVNAHLAARSGTSLRPTEWWLNTDPGRTAQVVEALRQRAGGYAPEVLVRDETARRLLEDPLGAGSRSALLAASVAAAALAAVGFAVSVAGSSRERATELAVLRALGTPRRRLVRMVAGEQSARIAVSLVLGLVLGAVLTQAVVPLTVLTGMAAPPVPHVLVELPLPQVAVLLAGVAAMPLVVVGVIAARSVDPAKAMRYQGDE
ncbi:FtsX-like permease family protein [Streptomyces djakartensis]|uniref:FtsX-like permease family protein n=1 Tax=Streptomyces djakartensis TaxID=68193 RepID=UPI0034DEED1F